MPEELGCQGGVFIRFNQLEEERGQRLGSRSAGPSGISRDIVQRSLASLPSVWGIAGTEDVQEEGGFLHKEAAGRDSCEQWKSQFSL